MEKNERIKIKRARRLFRLFFAFMIAPTLLWALICFAGMINPKIKAAFDKDLGENRNFAKFPESFSSDWPGGVEKYYNDRAPFRSLLITANDNLSEFIEKPYTGGIKDGLIAMFYGEQEQETTATPTVNIDDLFGNTEATTTSGTPTTGTTSAVQQTNSEEVTTGADESESDTEPQTESQTEPVTAGTTASQILVQPTAGDIDTSGFLPPDVRNDMVVMGRGDWLYLYGYGAINYYLGNNILTEAEMAEYATAVRNCMDVCARNGKQLVMMYIPEKTQVYPEYMPNYEVLTDYKRTQRLTDYLRENTGVPIYYPINELIAVKPYYPTYMKYDSHWNYVGAFIGCQMLNRLVGMEVTNPLTLPITTSQQISGDLVTVGGLNIDNYVNDVKHDIEYKPEIHANYVSGASSFESDIYHVICDVGYEKKMVLVGDSYRNNMAMFLHKDFRDSTLMHFRNLMSGTPEAVNAVKDSELICVVLVERNDHVTKDLMNYISYIIEN